jgi:hypothetical protein
MNKPYILHSCVKIKLITHMNNPYILHSYVKIKNFRFTFVIMVMSPCQKQGTCIPFIGCFVIWVDLQKNMYLLNVAI